MGTWIKIGFRNLLKNKRRSAFTVGAIAFGFAAVNLLGGFTTYVFRGIESAYVYAYGNGHLTVFCEGFLTEGALKPTQYLLSSADIDRITAICAEDDRISKVTPRLNITGMVSNGKVSTIMVAEGRVPSDTRFIREQGIGRIATLRMFEGEELSDGDAYGVGISRGLAKKLELALDSTAIVMAPTVDGFMNALDSRTVQLLDAPLELLDNMLMTVPLAFARELYDTTSADRLTVLLSDPRDLAAVHRSLQQHLADEGLQADVRPWQELRPSYLRIKNMFDVIFSFVYIIVFTIVVLSVVNTVSMAVLERTREIGTLRALGLKRHGVITMFATESALLGLFGSLIGCLLVFAGWVTVKLAAPTWMPPNIPKRVPLEIYLVPDYMVLSLLALVALAVCAAVFPARRAARMAIIDALGHV